MAPISLVQAILAGGAVTLAVLSQRLFGDPVGQRRWLALTVGAVGLVLLVVTLPRFHGSDSSFSPAAIASFEGGLILLASAIALGHRSERLMARRGILRAVLAGLLFALAGIAIKAVTGGAGGPVGVATLVAITVATAPSPSTPRSPPSRAAARSRPSASWAWSPTPPRSSAASSSSATRSPPARSGSPSRSSPLRWSASRPCSSPRRSHGGSRRRRRPRRGGRPLGEGLTLAGRAHHGGK